MKQDWYEKKATEYEPLISKYLDQYNYLSSPTKLAKIIVKKERIPHGYDSFRKFITLVQNKKEVKEVESILTEDDWQFNVPDTDYEDIPPFSIPKSVDSLLCLYDIHLPYHDKNSLLSAIKYGKDRGINGIYLGGDVIDFYQISRYLRDPKYRSVKSELDIGRQFLTELRDKFKDIPIYFKEGNHELRWTNFLMQNAPQLFELEELQLREILNLKNLRIEFIDGLQVTQYGHLNLLHGHEIFGGGINNARNKRLKANDNIMFGHHHRTQEDIVRTIKNKAIGSWAVGCLCGLSPRYMPINDWNNGFAVVERDIDDTFSVENHKIINGFIK